MKGCCIACPVQPIRALQQKQQLAVQAAEATQAVVQNALAIYEANARAQSPVPSDTAAGVEGHLTEATKHQALYKAALAALATHPAGALRERLVACSKGIAELPSSVAGMLGRTSEGRAVIGQVLIVY